MKKRIWNLVRIFKNPYRFKYGKIGIYICHSKMLNNTNTIPFNPKDYDALLRKGTEAVWFFSIYEP